MEKSVALSAFRPYAALLSDAGGRVAFCNRKAAALAGGTVGQMAGRPCWEVLGLVDAKRAPFCSADCPLQRQARRGRLEPQHRVVALSRRGAPTELELLAFVVPPHSPRREILHLMRPAAAEVERAGAVAGVTGRLTARETQVLRLLAAGCDTSAIASRLFISPATVRNHVQHILAKLGVHDRLQAILALLQGREIPRE